MDFTPPFSVSNADLAWLHILKTGGVLSMESFSTCDFKFKYVGKKSDVDAPTPRL